MDHDRLPPDALADLDDLIQPTREQLLAAVERVRRLHTATPVEFSGGTIRDVCETCSGDPMAPEFHPCPTVRALDADA